MSIHGIPGAAGIPPARQSTEADIEALDTLCEQLSGFGDDIALEWVDGFMTALLAGRRTIMPGEWLPAMFGDAFDRAFTDPQSVQQAMGALMARWNVIASQLHPEALVDDAETLRLAPLMMTYDDEARAEIVAAGHLTAEQAEEQMQTGALWAEGFADAIEAFAADWPAPEAGDDDPEAAWYDDALTRVLMLALPKSRLDEMLKEQFPGDTLTRDELIDEACWAVQDLRLYWLEHGPRPETRRVAPTPGRNDPCPCGSGRKYKKCHGASA